MTLQFAYPAAESHPVAPAGKTEHDSQLRHILRLLTGILLWRHRATTAEPPFT